MTNFADLTGKKFGRLIALHRLHNTKCKTKWLCVCECGNFIETQEGHLRSGHTKSCGCLQRDISSQYHIKHNKCDTRLYNTWCNMKKRCYAVKFKDYRNYGGRGIKVCDEWLNDFMSFYDWSMNNGYKECLSIDRIDVNGNYEPSNCRWATMKQQSRNTRRNNIVTFNNVSHCVTDWCDLLGIKRNTVYKRLSYGWNMHEALGLVKRGRG